MNAAQLALDSLDKFGDFDAFHFEGRAWSSLEHSAYSNRLATVLRDLGIRPGDPVMVVMPNCPEVLACFQAIWRIGAVIAPITPQLGERELAYVMEHSEAKAVITSGELADKIAAASQRASGSRLLFALGATDRAADLSGAIETASPWESLVDCADDDLAFLLYTSGTTGHPKGVMLSHRNIVSNHTAVAKFERLKERDATILVLPLSHSFGVLIMDLCFIFGNKSSVHRRFEPEEICRAIEQYRVSNFSVVPTMLVRMLEFPARNRFDLSSLKIVNSGGAILPNEVRVAFEREFNCRVLDGYGLSECAPTACSYHSSETIRPGSVGHAIPGVTVTIRDEEGAILPAGERGEICIAGPNVMKGYLKDPEASARALQNGYLHSGDLGYVDADGYVFLTDRKKDLIIKGGENISPREIEEALYEHPAVTEVVIVGVPDARYGENIVAVIALKPGKSATEAELIAHAGQYVTKFKLPKRIVFKDALPKNANGKIDRKLLRAEVASSGAVDLKIGV